MRRITDPAELKAHRLSYIPKDSRLTAQHVRSKLGDAEAWVWADSRGKPCAVAFFGRSQHPYSGNGGRGSVYRFARPESRAAWVRDLFARAAAHAQRRSAENAEESQRRAQGHRLAVGDVLRSSWGYDQTNIDYYQVTRLAGKTLVEVRKIAAQSAEDRGYMSGSSVPNVGAFCGPALRRRVSLSSDLPSVAISSCQQAYKITPTIVGGVPVYAVDSWTAYA